MLNTVNNALDYDVDANTISFCISDARAIASALVTIIQYPRLTKSLWVLYKYNEDFNWWNI